MQDPQNREVMAALYRIMEKYEVPKDCDTDEDILHYFDGIRADIEQFYQTYWVKARNEYARTMAGALYDAISKRFALHHDAREHRDDAAKGGMIHT